MADLRDKAASLPRESERYDVRGMPLTVSAAQAMTVEAIDRAMTAALARLKRKTVAEFRAATRRDANGSPMLDSQEVVWLIAEFSRPFERPAVDLARVTDRQSWSTIGGLADVVKGNLS